MTSGDGGTKPRITAKKNGPYIVNDVEDLKNSQGEVLPTQPEMALCRCGGSEDKPYCDGTHFLVGFDGQCQNNGEKNRVKDYEGRDITVHDNRWACSHIGYCSGGLPAVFKPKDRPWVQPDEAPADEVEATVRLCPSGALCHTRDGVLSSGSRTAARHQGGSQRGLPGGGRPRVRRQAGRRKTGVSRALLAVPLRRLGEQTVLRRQPSLLRLRRPKN